MRSHVNHVPLLGFAAYSGTGKTTLLEALLPKLVASGLRVGMLKHAHHDFDVDKPGKDSHRLRKAGASQMLIASRLRHVMMTETPSAEADFDYLLSRFDTRELDVILVEGCKNIAFPKIELHRLEVGKPWLHPFDDNIIAIAADTHVASTSLPQLSINDIDTIAMFVRRYVSDNTHNHETAKLNNISCESHTSALSVEHAQQSVLDAISPCSTFESIPTSDGLDRVLAETVYSPVNVPPFNNSALDGFAIRADDLAQSSYRIVGTIYAGMGIPAPIGIGEALRIMTGAPLPSADYSVVMYEQATTNGDTVTFSSSNITSQQNVRHAGEDLRQNDSVFSSGTRLSAPELGMLSSLGLTHALCYRPLKVALFSTGNEVVAPGSTQHEGAIFDSNRTTLAALLTRSGYTVLDMGILPDDQIQITRALEEVSLHVDAIVTSGGVSVGDADHVKAALNTLGSNQFWRIAMRPGRPFAFGQINQKPFFGLPGNPVAVMVSYLMLVEPALRKLQGEQSWQPMKLTARAAEPLRSRIGRTEFSRGYFSIDSQGQVCVKTTGEQGSGILRSMSNANCLIEIAPYIDTVKVGESVTIIPLQGRI
ncbi:bifunctional molybdopterin-guanine dinucleotide biosynthesis adaptor protein MobB/molybdopterin molybdotransferase MoeA [Vibrio sp. SM6]|uniref:Molybdopterin molybdenumtransferase n=1 Tax=Vibrio agarilyticus TaxID=2726741 RepID=A0A7X8TPT7_9VIBR|nr:bifunctional molybdopterin-guanine dinucleotide biosynthesis adaptor protein MobB/molybdopterin molybdotransferase MoeA [Vibrio agarilyticus]NLS12648.1 bifunctional molybdopterin-guanine dinucleotide biosynthesis adaptor protein MobB/molybdopterin molybdotransferase MoeA [Vibrio agarilyticus]